MTSEVSRAVRILRRILGKFLIGPQTLAFLPALTLGGYWYGGEGLLLFVALLIPAVFAVAGLFSGTGPAWTDARDGITGLPLRPVAEKAIGQMLASANATGLTTAAVVLEIDGFDTISEQYGSKATASLLKQTAQRISGMLRDNDVVAKIDEHRFGVALGPMRRADLEIMIQLSARLQATLAEPFSIDATRVYLTASVGFCLPGRATAKTGEALLDCAGIALDVARSVGRGSIRAYSADTKQRIADQEAISEEISAALETGQINAWFQPQISTHTGEITGFEAMARWEHPERGILLPSDFVSAVAEHSLHARLGEIVLSQALLALKNWTKAGHSVPAVSVKFVSEELSNPKICEKVRWELDRYDLASHRLCVEISEDVIAASEDDAIVQNIIGFSSMGCRIDLDDFGTGHASIANIRRFAVNRIKIDRSFITRVDRDRDQQNMVAAVLTMAERLELDTIAEGVETLGEHAMLSQLGCGHVQGISVAKPMRFADTADWILQHQLKLSNTTIIGRKAV